MNEHHIVAFDPQSSVRIEQFYANLEKVVGPSRFTLLNGGFLKSIYNKLTFRQKISILWTAVLNSFCSLWIPLFGESAKIQAGVDEYVLRVIRLRNLANLLGAFPLRLVNRLYWNLSAEALSCLLKKYSGSVTVIIPDEAYSIPFVIKRNCKPNIIWITNINSYQLNFNLFKYEHGHKYLPYGRNSWKPVDVSPELAKLEVDNYFQSLFDARMDHHDYSRTYNPNKKIFNPMQSDRKRLLVAAHIFCDAPSAHDMVYKDFEEWLTAIWSSNHLLADDYDVYIKEHPSVSIYQERGVLHAFVDRLGINWEVIPSELRVNLQDFDLVMTCNGSICYECNYLGVPVISGSRGFSENLPNVYVANEKRIMVRFLRHHSAITNRKYDRDYTVLFNWVCGRDALRLKESYSDPILSYCEQIVPLLNDVQLNSSYTTFVADDLNVKILGTE